LVVWLALMVRKMLLIIGAVFAPIAFGGSPFDVTSSWVKRWIEFTAALVLSKLVLVILFGVGVQIELGLGKVGSATTQEITQMMTGLLVMAVAGFAPWLALQFVHWAGTSVQWELHQRAQAVQAGGQAAIAAPQRMYAGAQRGVGGLAVAAGRLSNGSSGNGSGSPGGSGGNGASGGGGSRRGGGRDDGGSSSPGNGVTGSAESAYESGRSQMASALAQNGGSPAGAAGRVHSRARTAAGRTAPVTPARPGGRMRAGARHPVNLRDPTAPRAVGPAAVEAMGERPAVRAGRRARRAGEAPVAPGVAVRRAGRVRRVVRRAVVRRDPGTGVWPAGLSWQGLRRCVATC